MKKSSGRVILQILSAVLGSVLFSVSVFLMILGESITALVVGLASAVYLTARVLAAVKEKDKNGPLNIFAVVFIILLCLLCLIAVKRLPLTTSEGEESKTEGTSASSTVIITEKPEREGKDTSESAPSSVTSVTETPVESEAAEAQSQGTESADVSAGGKTTVEIASFSIAGSVTTVSTGFRVDTVSVDREVTGEAEASAEVIPAVQPEEETEEEPSVRVPSAPVFVSSVSASVPSSPSFSTGGAVAEIVPDVPEIGSPVAQVVPDAPSFGTVFSALAPASPSFGTVSSALVPEAPQFDEPSAILVELDVPTHSTSTKTEEEYDPWADFFFSDEDLSLDDGLYYFTLFVNDFEEGDVEVLVEDGEVYISASELSDYIYAYLEPESAERIFGGDYDYYSVDYLNYVGVDAWADTNFFEYYITISSTDLPVTRISVKGNSSKSVVRPISGAVTIDPVNYYVISSYSLSASSMGKSGQSFLDSLRLSLSSNNSFRLFNLYGSFSWSLSGSYDSMRFSWGSYSFYRDIEDLSVRLRFGNVSPDSFSPSGTSIGIRIDKSSQYSGESDGSDDKNQYQIVLDRDSDVAVYNGEREIFRRTLSAGRYILYDFILYSGTNEIRIVITPTDGSEGYEESFTIVYSSSILDVGEVYWGAAYAFSRTVVNSSSERKSIQVDIPFFGNRKLRYDLSDFALSGYVNLGISENLSASVTAALKGVADIFSFRVSGEITNLNALGTLKISGNFSYATTASLYIRASQQFTISGKGLVRGLSAGVTFTKSDFSVRNNSVISPSISLSGALGFMGWSVSAAATATVSDFSQTTWNIVPSLTFSLGKLSLSVSATVSGVGKKATVTYSGRLSASFRIKGVSTTVSTSGKDTSVSASYSGDGYSISGRARTSDILKAESYSYSADFSSSTSLFSYSAAASTTGSFESISVNANMNFASVFAEGLFSFSSSVPSSFLLIQQKGALRGNEVSVAVAGSSTSTVPTGYVGAILYRGLASSGAVNLSLYSENTSGFSSGQSFDIFIADTDNRGYVVTLEGESTYTVCGTAQVGDYIWSNGSSPLYRAYIDDDGVITLESTDEYAFTDRTGMYIISDLTAGTYGFDVRANGKWYLMLVTVGKDNDPNLVTMLREKNYSVLTPPDVYEGVIETEKQREISADMFWFELYGEAQ